MKKIILLFLFLILTNQYSSAILEEEKIDLLKAIQTALNTNPQIKILNLDIETSKNDIKSATKLQNPNIGANFNMGKANEENPQVIGADYTVEILKRGKRKKTAQSALKASENNLKFGEANLVLEVKKAYIDFLLKKANLKIINEQKELAKELLDNSVKNANENKIPKSEVIQAKIEYNRSVMYSNTASWQVVSSQNHFNSVMNTSDINYDTKEDYLTADYEKLLTVNPEDNSIDFEKIKAYALLHRSDLLKAKQEVITSQYNLKVIKSNLIPDVELEGGYGYQIPATSASGRYLSGAYAGVNLINIPLIYRYKPEIKNAYLEIQKNELKYKDAEIDAIRNITDAWEKFSIAKNNLNFYNKELLDNSKELIEASKTSLNKKEIDMTSFLVSKKLYYELMLGYQEALAEYYISYAELLREIDIPYTLNIQEIENL